MGEKIDFRFPISQSGAQNTTRSNGAAAPRILRPSLNGLKILLVTLVIRRGYGTGFTRSLGKPVLKGFDDLMALLGA